MVCRLPLILVLIHPLIQVIKLTGCPRLLDPIYDIDDLFVQCLYLFLLLLTIVLSYDEFLLILFVIFLLFTCAILITTICYISVFALLPSIMFLCFILFRLVSVPQYIFILIY